MTLSNGTREFSAGKRWKIVLSGRASDGFVVAPQGQSNIGIVLDRPASAGTESGMKDYTDRIGKETNWVFQVADCVKLFEVLSSRGVKFIAPPKTQPWGTSQAVFEDLYGNTFVVESSAQGRR
jgi:predicted enzyme related to lactoylglutathione lyase